MIKSELYRGKIYAGATKLASTIEYKETKDGLTARGTLTGTDGQVFEIDETVKRGETLRAGGVWVVLGWEERDVYVLAVLPGFPEGTTAADWKMTVGRIG